MTKKLKYSLLGVGFLGINAVVFLVLRSTLKSFDPLKGIWTMWSSGKEPHLNDYKLNLDTKGNTSRLDLSGGLNSLQEVKLNIDSGKEDLLDTISPLLGSSTDQNHSDSIKNIFDEILREIQTKNLEHKMDSKYEELSKKYLEVGGSNRQTMLFNFQKAESNIKKWLETKSKSNYKAPQKSLSPEERISLQKFYELYYELSGRGKRFSTELQEVSGGTGASDSALTSNNSTPSLESVQRSLRVIDWNKKKIRVLPTVSTRFFSTRAWGDWDKNPYKPFYSSEEEFRKHLNAMNSSSLKINRLEQEISRERSMWGGMGRAEISFQAQSRQVKELKENQSSEIEYHIGSKLLDFMSR